MGDRPASFASEVSTKVECFGPDQRCITKIIPIEPTQVSIPEDSTGLPTTITADTETDDPLQSQTQAPLTGSPSIGKIRPTETPLITGEGAGQTASPTMASSTSNGKGSGGVSPGAVAGIAIGTAIAGAAIAFLIAFLLFKKRRGNERRTGPAMAMGKYESNPELVSLSPTKGPGYVPAMQTIPPPAPATAVGNKNIDLANLANSSSFLAGVLPRSADSSVVRSKVANLFDQISQHVESFYRDVHASITPSMESDIAKFGRSSTPMMELLQGSSSPTVAIKHALVGYILAITSPDGSDEETLFPREISAISSGVGTDQLLGSPDLAAPYILHRRLSTYLHDTLSHTRAQSSTLNSSIREAAEHFALTFFNWANPGYGDHEKDEDLVQIIHNALEIVVWLYGQPFVYEFAWEGVGARGILVAPALVKISDESGKVVRKGERGEVLLEARVVGT